MRHARGAFSVPTQPHASLCAARTPPLVTLLTIRSGVHQPAVPSEAQSFIVHRPITFESMGFHSLLPLVCFTACGITLPRFPTGWIEICTHGSSRHLLTCTCCMRISGSVALHEYKKLSHQFATRLRRGFLRRFLGPNVSWRGVRNDLMQIAMVILSVVACRLTSQNGMHGRCCQRQCAVALCHLLSLMTAWTCTRCMASLICCNY